jgi:RND family efflux transporter MFP subunit
MKKPVKIIIAVTVAAALVAGGVKAIKNARAKDAAAPAATLYPLSVKTMAPKPSRVTLTLPYLTEVGNDKDVRLASRIAARIVAVTPSGASVKKGEVVVRLDTTSIESALASVRAQIAAADVSLKNLRATHERTLELLKVQGASVEESQKEESMIAAARASRNALKQKAIELKNNLSYATIRSPVGGVVAKTFANPGALSAPGKPLVAIASKNGFYLMVRVPTGLAVDGVVLDGKTYAATPLDATYHGLAEYKVYVGDRKLTSGDRVEADVVVFDGNATLLPFDAVLNRNGKSYVLITEGDRAGAQEVHVVQSGEQGVAVSDTLSGKNVVVEKPDILLKLLSGHLLKVRE